MRPVFSNNSLLSKDGQSIYVAAGRHVEVDGGVFAWELNPKTGAIKQSFQLHLPISKFPTDLAWGHSYDQPDRFRGNQPIVANHLLLGGLAYNAGGKVCFINRKWKGSGSRASGRGYWHELMHRSEDRTHAGMPDPMSPHYNLQPINFDKWNGQVINPIEAYYKRGRGDYKQRTMFQASRQTPKDKPKSQKGADNEEAELDDLLDGIPDL